MAEVEGFFAQSYALARDGFVAACEAARIPVQSHPHPLLGRDGEALAMDVARLGARDAAALLIISSACHGVEGFAGSGVQRALLADRTERGFLASAQRAGVAVLLIHALNPYGFSWWRRATHENVDLNRNWQDFSRLPPSTLPSNAAYDAIQHWLLPEHWPPSAENETHLAAWTHQHGAAALQTALTAGQYAHPQGLFFGGHRPTWSQQTLRHVLREHATRCQRLAWIDLHTGLGPSGHGERIHAYRPDDAALTRARQCWGPGVTSIYDGSSASAVLTGLMWSVVDEECAQARYTGLAMEYGTQPLHQVMLALRAEQWIDNHPQADDALRQLIKQQFRDAFYIDTAVWKEQVVAQGTQAAQQAVLALGADAQPGALAT